MEFGFENIEIKAGLKTPFIRLDKDAGVIEIKGRSFPENAAEFYYHFNRWLAEYSSNPAKTTTVSISLLYLNSSSVVVITRMMKLLDGMISMNTELKIKWHFEEGDADIEELGLHFKTNSKCEVELIEVDLID